MSLASGLAFLAVVAATLGVAEWRAARPPRSGATRARPRLAALVRRLGAGLGIPVPRGLAVRAAAAGVEAHPRDLVALKAGLALVAFVSTLPLAGSAPGRLGIVLALAAPAAGYVTPDLALARRARARAERMSAELPDVLDLLNVAIRAGLPPRRALAEVGRRHGGLLAREFARATRRARLGEPLDAALADLAERCSADGVGPLVDALRRAERHGAPLGRTLSAQSREARAHRARHLAERAARATPKIQLVVALLLVPAALLLVAAALVPALTG